MLGVQIGITPPRMGSPLDILVSRDGVLHYMPWLAVGLRTALPGTTTHHRQAEASVVRVMLTGQLLHCCSGRASGASIVDVDGLLVTHPVAYSLTTISSEPARYLEVWLREARTSTAMIPRPRTERIGRIATLIEIGIAAIRAAVLPIGGAIDVDCHGLSFVVPTVGRISVDGVVAEPRSRVQLLGRGPVTIHALESTEVILLTRCDASSPACISLTAATLRT